jgi:hypothetical protein
MYNYQTERPWLFTDEGQRAFLPFRDKLLSMLAQTEACTVGAALSWVKGAPSSWAALACVDRMVELGELERVERANRAIQSQILVKR